jgi:hypothetical protein
MIARTAVGKKEGGEIGKSATRPGVLAFLSGAVAGAVLFGVVRAASRWGPPQGKPDAKSDEIPPPPVPAPTIDDASLGAIALAQWRLARRVRNMRAEGGDRPSDLEGHIDLLEEYARDLAAQLVNLGVVIFDPTGMPYDSRLDLKVISRETRVNLADDTVIETVVPSVSWDDRCIVRPAVVVGVPARADQQMV